ncbi:hypothetical protein pfor_3c0217 [Rhodobacteraceae bacterium SB2]|nr:hypothetical protein pfor_3c0217 [Rhodobacteraceae bacterium SB2]
MIDQTMFKRYAIYFVPKGALAKFGRAWLGWDCRKGQYISSENAFSEPLADREYFIKKPRKYGLHATLKAPFRLQTTQNEPALRSAFHGFCNHQKPAASGNLTLSEQGGFISLRPQRQSAALFELGKNCLEAFDPFRAPLDQNDLNRRRNARLSPRQNDFLHQWGYPYVLQEFQFHITLSSRLSILQREKIIPALKNLLAHELDCPFIIAHLALMGEDRNGQFHILEEANLSG